MPLILKGRLVGVIVNPATKARTLANGNVIDAKDSFVTLDVYDIDARKAGKVRSVKAPMAAQQVYQGHEGEEVELPVTDFIYSLDNGQPGVSYSLVIEPK